MKRIIPFICLLAFSVLSFAQQAPIAIVSSSGTTRLTSTLDSAAILAQDNDIIYLPGGNFAGAGFTKKVTVIGVGHNPDSTSATGRTVVTGSIFFSGGAEGSVLDGVYADDIFVYSNVKVYRSNVNTVQTYPGWPVANNILVDKCIIRYGFYAAGGAIVGSTVKNSIINNTIASFTSGINSGNFENNIILIDGVYGLYDAQLCTFRNNTFTGINDWTNNESNSFFYNNIFSTSSLPPLTNPGNASGNYLSQTAAATFVTVPANTYTYANDYIIKSTSPGHNGGTDGKDVGIYGGGTPWVKGNIPPNPHIRTKNVDAATGAGGTLRVRFNVSAQ